MLSSSHDDKKKYSVHSVDSVSPNSNDDSGDSHMINFIDPEAIDFQPLLVGPNGAAMTQPQHTEYVDFGPHTEDSSSYATSTMRGIYLLLKDTAVWFQDRSEWLMFVAGSSQLTKTEGFRNFKRSVRKSHLHSVASPSSRISDKIVRGGNGLLRATASTRCSFGCIALLLVFVALVVGTLSSGDESSFMNNDDIDLFAPSKISLPRNFRGMAEVTEGNLTTGTPVYWMVPRSGSKTMANIVASCFGKIVASDVDDFDGRKNEESLQIIPRDFGNFVNVDMVRPAGIQRAKRLGLVSSGVAGAIFSPYIKETTSLFDRKEKGRLFTMIRAPVYRIVSKYYYLKDQGLLHYDNSTVTMEQFIASDDDNWMVRALSSSPRSRIGERELNIAKEVLRKHVLVGLWEEKAESLRRIEQYFGWELPSPVAESCMIDKLHGTWDNMNPHPEAQDEDLLLLIQEKNQYDFNLYFYAKKLFQEQTQLFKR